MPSWIKTLAQLLRMDGPRTEIIQRGDEISYFEPGFDSFTLSGEHIVDALPSVVFPDFEKLSKYYNYIALGRARIADRPCQVIRVVARDSTRYSYIIWMDETTKLPMRVDLLDRDGETLEQFRVISFAVGEPIQEILRGVLKLPLPPLLALPAKTRWISLGLRVGYLRGLLRFRVVAAHCLIWIHQLNHGFTLMVCLAFQLM